MNQLDYYTKETLKNMSTLERLLGDKMFHESYPILEKQFWQAVDNKDLFTVRKIKMHLDKEIDRANGIIMEF